MHRRLLALYIALSLALGIVLVPSQAVMICRMTGCAMAAAAVTPVAEHPSCCAGKMFLSGAAPSPTVALSGLPCCKIKAGRSHPLPPALPASSASPFALLAEPVLAPEPVRVSVAAVSAPRLTDAAPRAPPLRLTAPRAPPAFF